MLFFYKDAMDDEILYDYDTTIFKKSKNRHKSNFLKTAKAILSNRTTMNRRFRLSQLEWKRLQNHGKLVHISAFFDLLDRTSPPPQTITSMISNPFIKRNVEDLPRALNEKLQSPVPKETQMIQMPNMNETKKVLNGFMQFLNEQCSLFTMKEAKKVLARIKQNYRTFQNKGLRVKLINNYQFMYDILYCALVEFLSFKYNKISFLVFTHELFNFNINQFLDECIHYQSKRKPFKPNYEINRPLKYTHETDPSIERDQIIHNHFNWLLERYFRAKSMEDKNQIKQKVKDYIKKLLDKKAISIDTIKKILKQYEIIERKSDGSEQTIKLKPEFIDDLVP
jgi:hypothetical protein